VALTTSRLAEVLSKREKDIGDQWLELQSLEDKRSSASERLDTSRRSREVLGALKTAAQNERLENLSGPGWARTRELLQEFSSSRAKGGSLFGSPRRIRQIARGAGGSGLGVHAAR